MRLIIPSLTVLLSNALSVFSQERIWTKQTKITDVIAFEKENSPLTKFLSKNVGLSKDYYPLLDKYPVANPIIAQRVTSGYLPLYAEYFYSPGDSILRLISYDWEKDRYGNFFEKQKIWKEENSKLGIYNSEYETIKRALLTELGTPSAADNEVKELNTNGTQYFSRNALWENNNYKATLNMIFAPTTYRIRLTLYWKN